MFGILYTLFLGGVYLTGNARNAMINAENKKKYYRASSNSYIDYRGVWRSVSNNEALRVDTVNGDKCVIEERTKRVVRNVSEDNRIADKAQAIKDGKTVYKYSDGYDRDRDWRTGEDVIKGKVYIDLETGARYVVRRVYGYEFYMDMSTFMLVRLTDSCIEFYNDMDLSQEKIDKLLQKGEEFRNRFNGYQRDVIKKGDKRNERFMNGYYTWTKDVT